MSRPSASPAAAPNQTLAIPGWVWLAAFVVLVLRVSMTMYDRNFTSYDDGVAAEGARLVLLGKIPYRDFWTMYSPGGYYVNALGLAILGERLISIRIVGVVLGVVQAVLLYAISRRLSCKPQAMAVAAVAYLAFIPIGMPTYWFTTALAVIYSLVRLIDEPRPRWAVLCGVFLGLTVLLRQDAGAYLSVAALPMIYVIARRSGLRGLAFVARAGGAVAAICAAAVAYFAANGALPALVRDTLYFPLFVFPKSRPLPYPVPWRELNVVGPFDAPMLIGGLYQLFTFYLLPAALVVLSAACVWRWLKGGRNQAYAYAAVLCVMALVLFAMVGVRPSGMRVAASVAMSLVAFTFLASDASRALRIGGWAMLLGSVVAYAPLGYYTVGAQHAYATSVIAGSGGVYAAAGHAEALSLTCRRVKELTSPSEKILCGAPVIYFLTQRDPATRYYEPHPCLTDTPVIERAIIRDIEANRVRYLVRSREWDLRSGFFTIEPNHQPKQLIRYIERNYRMEQDFALFGIYKRVTPFVHYCEVSGATKGQSRGKTSADARILNMGAR